MFGFIVLVLLDSVSTQSRQCYGSFISDYESLEVAYGTTEENWGDRSIFQGGYINLGYWENIFVSGKKISNEDRVESGKNLYFHILQQLNLSSGDKVLEIGCGRGKGMVDAIKHYNLSNIVGIDAVRAQIGKSKERVSEERSRGSLTDVKIELLHAPGDKTQQSDKSIDKVYSVEIIQHFEVFEPFAQEIKRILKPNGKAVFAAHLSTRKDSVEKMVKEGLLVGEGFIDVFVSIGDVVAAFRKNGFNVRYYSIGENIFGGFEQYLLQEHPDNVLGLNLCQSYKRGLIDYYVIIVNNSE